MDHWPEAIDRRNKRRVTMNQAIEITIGDRQIPCTLVNISEEGALLRFGSDQNDKIGNDDLGEEASFVLSGLPDSRKRREYTGEIIRFYGQGEDTFVGLRFWQPYREVR